MRILIVSRRRKKQLKCLYSLYWLFSGIVLGRYEHEWPFNEQVDPFSFMDFKQSTYGPKPNTIFVLWDRPWNASHCRNPDCIHCIHCIHWLTPSKKMLGCQLQGWFRGLFSWYRIFHVKWCIATSSNHSQETYRANASSMPGIYNTTLSQKGLCPWGVGHLFQHFCQIGCGKWTTLAYTFEKKRHYFKILITFAV